jgi:glycosyltransferase involved in cell wall biosynthesis
VSDGRDGALVPVDDVDALAAALDGLLADEDRRHRLGQAARTKVAEQYSAEAMALGIEAVYAEVVGGA